MTVHERPFGRYFEDFEPGDVYKHWPGKTVTEYDDHLFCMHPGKEALLSSVGPTVAN